VASPLIQSRLVSIAALDLASILVPLASMASSA
jgi:hypothetical protein